RDVEAVGNPRAEPENHLDTRLVRGRDRDGAAHREPEQERPLAAELLDRGPGVFDAPVQPLPGLDPVAHLAEAKPGMLRREPPREPLERRAPRPGHLGALAPV